MVKRNIIWATKELRKGKMVRRKQWVSDGYLFVDELGDIHSGWKGHKKYETRELCFSDLEADDWEVALE